jgi:hypothetical protein
MIVAVFFVETEEGRKLFLIFYLRYSKIHINITYESVIGIQLDHCYLNNLVQ